MNKVCKNVHAEILINYKNVKKMLRVCKYLSRSLDWVEQWAYFYVRRMSTINVITKQPKLLKHYFKRTKNDKMNSIVGNKDRDCENGKMIMKIELPE